MSVARRISRAARPRTLLPTGVLLLAGWLSAPALAQSRSPGDATTAPVPLTVQFDRSTEDNSRTAPGLALPETAPDLRAGTIDPALGTAVRLRSRPSYDANPIPVGAFDLNMVGSLTGGYDSNVFRLRHGPGDAFGTAQFTGLLSTTQPVDRLFVKATLAQQSYTKYTTENAFTYNLEAGGQLDFANRDTLTFTASQAHEVRERSAATEVVSTLRPIRYDLSTANLSGHKTFGRLAIDTSLLFAYYNYHNAQLLDGTPLDENFRDNNDYTARVDLSYALGPGPVLYVAGQGRLVRYLNGNALGRTLDSDQVQITAGLRGQISPLLSGQIGAGYLHANLKQGGNQGGPTVEASLRYLATELTTVSLNADRSFQNVGSIITPLTLQTQVSLQVDHELLRNLILTAVATYRNNRYDTANGGSHEYDGRGGLEWLLDHHLRVTADAGYRHRAGFGETLGRNFQDVVLTAGLAYRP